MYIRVQKKKILLVEYLKGKMKNYFFFTLLSEVHSFSLIFFKFHTHWNKKNAEFGKSIKINQVRKR